MTTITRVAVLLLVWMCVPASAQQYSLVGGTWIHSEDVPDYNHPGSTIHGTYIAQFLQDGRLIVRTGVASPYTSQEFVTVWRYQLTSASSYSEVEIDYSPKQVCAAGLCTPAVPQVPMGSRFDCNFEFTNEDMVVVSCPGNEGVRYSRH